MSDPAVYVRFRLQPADPVAPQRVEQTAPQTQSAWQCECRRWNPSFAESCACGHTKPANASRTLVHLPCGCTFVSPTSDNPRVLPVCQGFCLVCEGRRRAGTAAENGLCEACRRYHAMFIPILNPNGYIYAGPVSRFRRRDNTGQ